MSRCLHLAALLVALASATPTFADPTPTLPFWSRPFPAGYVGRRVYGRDHFAERSEPCTVVARVRTRDGRLIRRWQRCGPPLHVMD